MRTALDSEETAAGTLTDLQQQREVILNVNSSVRNFGNELGRSNQFLGFLSALAQKRKLLQFLAVLVIGGALGLVIGNIFSHPYIGMLIFTFLSVVWIVWKRGQDQ